MRNWELQDSGGTLGAVISSRLVELSVVVEGDTASTAGAAVTNFLTLIVLVAVLALSVVVTVTVLLYDSSCPDDVEVVGYEFIQTVTVSASWIASITVTGSLFALGFKGFKGLLVATSRLLPSTHVGWLGQAPAPDTAVRLERMVVYICFIVRGSILFLKKNMGSPVLNAIGSLQGVTPFSTRRRYSWAGGFSKGRNEEQKLSALKPAENCIYILVHPIHHCLHL